jgi:hypothetical protein
MVRRFFVGETQQMCKSGDKLKASPCEAALSVVAAQLDNVISALEAEQHEHAWELLHELRYMVRNVQMGG